jgi:anhydro-N-acetylmuramic acid kinase
MNFYIGLMSGTSCDGVDASLVQTDGLEQFKVINNLHLPYSSEFHARLKHLLSNHSNHAEIEVELTLLHVFATNELLEKSQLKSTAIKAIGFHGQTVLHNPGKQFTWQMGDPHLLAIETGIDVIYDFRRRDIALGKSKVFEEVTNFFKEVKELRWCRSSTNCFSAMSRNQLPC